ncbi:MAG: hypothetical protein M3P08_00115 [Thermoproteota archaeon]|nr:hypothetical protein [Thermoproteota archaeon]
MTTIVAKVIYLCMPLPDPSALGRNRPYQSGGHQQICGCPRNSAVGVRRIITMKQ